MIVAAAVNVAFVAADAAGVVGFAVVDVVAVWRAVDDVVAAVALRSVSAVSDALNVDVVALAHQVRPTIMLNKIFKINFFGIESNCRT